MTGITLKDRESSKTMCEFLGIPDSSIENLSKKMASLIKTLIDEQKKTGTWDKRDIVEVFVTQFSNEEILLYAIASIDKDVSEIIKQEQMHKRMMPLIKQMFKKGGDEDDT